MRRSIPAAALGVLAALALSAEARAQSSGSSSASSYSKGYGANAGELTNPVNVSTRDANGNRVITDGVIQTGTDNSMFGKLKVSGALDRVSGAGSGSGGNESGVGSATAIGNNLQVSVSGNYNTVIVNAKQTNTGAVTATTTVLNGKINLDGGQ